MKKLILLLAITVIMQLGWCQKTDLLKDAGAIAGAGLIHIFGGDSWDPTVGFLLGAETNVYNICSNSFIRTGILFTLQGASYTETYSTDYFTGILKSAQANGMEYSGKVTLSYLYIPILYHYRSEKGLYFEAGIQPGFLLSAKDRPEDGDSYDFKDYIKTFEIGIPAGIGYFVNNRVSVGARAVLGVPNINTEGTEMYSSEDKDKNFMLVGVVRFYLNLKE